MILYILLFALICSFTVHIFIVIRYVDSRSKKLFNAFISTSVTNMGFAIGLSVMALYNPSTIRNLDIKFILWVLSGFVMVTILFFKINILRNIYKRSQDPANYHLNYFGKKVYGEKVVKKTEYLGFIISFPFFLLIGAYFVARLLNLYLYGHL